MKGLLFDNAFWAIPLAMVVIALFYRIRLVLYIARKVYGNYSIQYIQLWRKYYGDTPFAHGINEELIGHIKHFEIQGKNTGINRSYADLRFSEMEMGIGTKKLIGKRGVPAYCSGKKYGAGTIMYIGYDKMVEGFKVKELFFFMNDSYFLGEYYFEYYSNKLPPGFFSSFYGLAGFDKKQINGQKVHLDINEQGRARLYEDNGFVVSVKYYNKDMVNKTLAKAKYTLPQDGVITKKGFIGEPTQAVLPKVKKLVPVRG